MKTYRVKRIGDKIGKIEAEIEGEEAHYVAHVGEFTYKGRIKFGSSAAVFEREMTLAESGAAPIEVSSDLMYQIFDADTFLDEIFGDFSEHVDDDEEAHTAHYWRTR